MPNSKVVQTDKQNGHSKPEPETDAVVNALTRFKHECSFREAAEMVKLKKQDGFVYEAMRAVAAKERVAREQASSVSATATSQHISTSKPFAERSAEHKRLDDSEQRVDDWKRFGPYVSERAWGTVREDYSESGDAWSSFPHDHARSRVYRWNEDGLAGVSDRHQNVCLGVAFWNEKDPIIKERLFGLTGEEGNKGEDVKELYYYVDSTPTHSYMKMQYKYPIEEYPYERLVTENQSRSRMEPECELVDILPEMISPSQEYFDCTVEYAKVSSEDILGKITVHNRSSNPSHATSPIHILPQCWFRNTWSWGYKAQSGQFSTDDITSDADAKATAKKMSDMEEEGSEGGDGLVDEDKETAGGCSEPQRLHKVDDNCAGGEFAYLGERYMYVESEDGSAPDELLFCDNETNSQRLFGTPNNTPFPKDGINNHVINNNNNNKEESDYPFVNPANEGSKFAAHFVRHVPAGESVVIRFRFRPNKMSAPFAEFDQVMTTRKAECDEFYGSITPSHVTPEEMQISRQALSGMLWSKQFYHYGVGMWLHGDPGTVAPPEARKTGRNAEWKHLYNRDVISMPDKWEYPWYAAWDLAFHTVALVLVDPEWAKRQLILLLREWYMSPSGQIPSYEWSFSDTNPPVHAWACYRVFKISSVTQGRKDLAFLERCFHKLLVNWTWWVNRKDEGGTNLFDGGFLGLDNIGVFDRSNLDEGWHLEQADSTAWMGNFCLDMLRISIELALYQNPVYEDMCSKFLEHFINVARKIRESLWDEETGFFYDKLHTPDGKQQLLKYRSFVGVLTVQSCMNLSEDEFDRLPAFKRRLVWFLEHRKGAQDIVSYRTELDPKTGKSKGKYLFSMLSRPMLRRVLERMSDPDEFLSPYGLRSLSKAHDKQHSPYTFTKPDGTVLSIGYEPGESETGMYGGNSGWRGSIWMPTNFVVVEALQRLDNFYDDSFLLEFPKGSGKFMTLGMAASKLSNRLISLFKTDPDSKVRPIHGEGYEEMSSAPGFKDLVLYYEYFHAETGKGLGASHQTGWTGLVAKLIHNHRL